MMTKSATSRSNLERSITEAMLRLKLARSQRDRKQADEHEKNLNRLLDKLSRDLGDNDG